jgi:hypothetical protein
MDKNYNDLIFLFTKKWFKPLVDCLCLGGDYKLNQSDIGREIQVFSSELSRAMKTLEKNDIVKTSKIGREVYYKANVGKLFELCEIFYILNYKLPDAEW